jgi:lipopolysaccharide export system protein LptA
MKNFLPVLALAVTCTAGLVALNAQNNPQTKPSAPQHAVAAQQQNDMQAQEAKAFNGTIVNEKGKLVLKDTTANVSYQLDNQEKAKQFEGKQVKVTGRLDLETNLIHVQNIELMS